MTYVFGLDLSYIQSQTIDKASGKVGAKKTGLKKSFASLASIFGKPLSSSVVEKQRPVAPSDFDGATIEELAGTTLLYQLNRMREIWEADPQFSEFIAELRSPSFTFAPYFYTPYGSPGTIWEAWHEVNKALSVAYRRLNGSDERHAVICIAPKILDSEKDVIRVVTEHIDSGCQAYWFWFSALAEDKLTKGRVQVLVKVANLLREADRRAYNLHGGFLSALLNKHGLTGFSHGVGYGESKDVIPVMGATVPTVNFHMPPLHIRVPILEVQRALGALGITDASEFHAHICDCTVCKGVLAGDLGNLGQFGDFVLKMGNTRQSQTPDSAKKCRFHFLLARYKEIETVASNSLGELKTALKQGADTYENLPAYLNLGNRAKHLNAWRSGL
jgi:hypothetical protein